MNNPQALAARIMTQALSEKKALNIVLSFYKYNNLVQEICYGTLRWFLRLQAIANFLIQKPLKEKDFDIYVLILIGFYQIDFMRMPDHAAVFETVQAAKQLKKTWAVKFINAILRNYLRNKKEIEKKIKNKPDAFYAHPDWMLAAFKKKWPNFWLDILHKNNQKPPMTLRINTLQLSREDYVKKLNQDNIEVMCCEFLPSAVILKKACSVEELPGYKEGEFSVQDCSPQLAAKLLSLLPGQRVLDACAAPGGKTTHILETEQNLRELVIIDNKEARLNKVKENLIRLKLDCLNTKLVLADAGCPTCWWDGQFFDRILLDVPCSATGVIRRHPDIKIMRQPQDILEKKEQQLRLLAALWPLLKPTGILLYASCSIFPEENTQVLEDFFKHNKDVDEEVIHADWGIPQTIGRQILPQDQMDGFFYARLRKIETLTSL